MTFDACPSLSAGWSAVRELLPRWHRLIDNCPARIAAHGDSRMWLDALATLPDVETEVVDTASGVLIGSPKELDARQRASLERGLMALQPWRKGPFDLFGIHIDTEWRSDWKWERIAPHIRLPHHALVADVGCGNGYYGWRLLGSGAGQVVGIDPTVLFAMQHAAVSRYAGQRLAAANALLPVRLEDLPPSPETFDIVLSLGVIYHRRDPIAHLVDLVERLRPGGQLVVESLVIDTDALTTLMPSPRYARMRNVWHVPSRTRFLDWLEKAGLADTAIVDVTATTTREQRSTRWMQFESLAQALDPENPTTTVEGYPAPVRAIAVGWRTPHGD